MDLLRRFLISPRRWFCGAMISLDHSMNHFFGLVGGLPFSLKPRHCFVLCFLTTLPVSRNLHTLGLNIDLKLAKFLSS